MHHNLSPESHLVFTVIPLAWPPSVCTESLTLALVQTFQEPERFASLHVICRPSQVYLSLFEKNCKFSILYF